LFDKIKIRINLGNYHRIDDQNLCKISIFSLRYQTKITRNLLHDLFADTKPVPPAALARHN
jgi:hypothetical protein